MTTRSVDDHLLSHLWRVAQASARENDALMAEVVAHSAAEIAVLRVVASGAANTPTKVARALRCSRANACKLIAKLAMTGHLDRHRHPDDARAISLRITTHGVDALNSGEAQLAEDAARAFAALDEIEKLQLLGLLQKVASTVAP